MQAIDACYLGDKLKRLIKLGLNPVSDHDPGAWAMYTLINYIPYIGPIIGFFRHALVMRYVDTPLHYTWEHQRART